MPDTMEIIDAICALAAREIPELKQTHVDLLPPPDAFLRPAILLESKGREAADAAAALLEITEKISIDIFDVTDDYSNSDTAQLLELRRKVLALFAAGFIRVGDRALAVTASSGGRDWDVAFVDVEFHFFDDRPRPETAQEPIAAVETNLTLKG